MSKILEKKSSTTYKELKCLVGLFSFAAKVIYPGPEFFHCLYDALAQGKNICMGLSLLQMIYYCGKNSYLDGAELHFYAPTVNVIPYGQTLPAFVVQEDTSYLDISLYKSSARTYLPATKSLLQAE